MGGGDCCIVLGGEGWEEGGGGGVGVKAEAGTEWGMEEVRGGMCVCFLFNKKATTEI